MRKHAPKQHRRSQDGSGLGSAARTRGNGPQTAFARLATHPAARTCPSTAIDHTHQTLVDLLAPYLSRELSELTPIERNILLLGAYELSTRIDIPFKVVISEAVALSKKVGATDGHKFVNGVLDQLAADARAIEVQALGTRERV